MEMLVIGFALGGLVVFAFTRHHKTEAVLYRRLYEEATKGGAQHLRDVLDVEQARAILLAHAAVERDTETVEDTAPKAPDNAPEPAPVLIVPGRPFECFECGERVNFGASVCQNCEAEYLYRDGKPFRSD